jgi:hypothetical protein
MVNDLKKGDKYINIAFGLSFALSIIMSITSVILLTTNVNMNIYTMMYNEMTVVQKVSFSALLWITQFYSYMIFLSNSIIFSATFLNHKMLVGEYIENLKNIGYTMMNLNEMFTGISEKKNNYKESVEKLNMMFSSSVITSYFLAYFIFTYMDDGIVSVINYIELSLIIIILASYIFSINKVMEFVDDLKSFSRDRNFSEIFLKKQEFNDIVSNTFASMPNFAPVLPPINSNTNYQSNMEMGMDEGAGVGYSGYPEISLQDIGFNENDNEIDIEDLVKYLKQISANQTHALIFLKQVRDLSFRSAIRDQESVSQTSWQILNTLLNDSWENFKLFGFEIEAPGIMSHPKKMRVHPKRLFSINDTRILGFSGKNDFHIEILAWVNFSHASTSDSISGGSNESISSPSSTS